MLSSIIDAAKALVRRSDINVSTFYQRCHYKMSVSLLIICSLLSCAKELFGGDHISCLSEGVASNIMDNYCFWTSSYIAYESSNLRGGPIYPGVGQIKSSVHKIKRIAYYQWVPYFLLFQAILFYYGRYFWKSKEGGRLSSDITYFNRAVKNHLKKWKNIKMEDFLKENRLYRRISLNRDWSAYFILTDFINLIVLLLQIFITHIFLQNQFLTLGFHFIMNPQEKFLDYIFPTVAKCEFYLFGPSGTRQNVDALCVIPLNVIHEKIFILLWFYYCLILLISLIATAERFMGFCFCHKWFGIFLRDGPHKDKINSLKTLNYLDYLYLKQLRLNMSHQLFELFIFILVQEMEKFRHEKKIPDEQQWQPDLEDIVSGESSSEIDTDNFTLVLT